MDRPLVEHLHQARRHRADEPLLTSEPAVVARPFRTLAARAVTPEERFAVLQRLMDSESRLGRVPEVRAAFEQLRAVVDLLDSAEDATAVRNNAATFLKTAGPFREAEQTLRSLVDSPRPTRKR